MKTDIADKTLGNNRYQKLLAAVQKKSTYRDPKTWFSESSKNVQNILSWPQG